MACSVDRAPFTAGGPGSSSAPTSRCQSAQLPQDAACTDTQALRQCWVCEPVDTNPAKLVQCQHGRSGVIWEGVTISMAAMLTGAPGGWGAGPIVRTVTLWAVTGPAGVLAREGRAPVGGANPHSPGRSRPLSPPSGGFLPRLNSSNQQINGSRTGVVPRGRLGRDFSGVR